MLKIEEFELYELRFYLALWIPLKRGEKRSVSKLEFELFSTETSRSSPRPVSMWRTSRAEREPSKLLNKGEYDNNEK